MNTLLEVALSLAFVYTLLSVLVSFLTEVLQRLMKSRGKMLKASMDRLLNDPANKNYSELLYEHPLVRGLRRDERHLPSYISGSTFVTALADLLRSEARQPRIFVTTEGNTVVDELPDENSFDVLKKGIGNLSGGEFKTRLSTLAGTSNTLGEFNTALDNWYTEYQEMISGEFRKKARTKTFLVGLFLTLFLNVDSIHLFRELYTDASLRTVMVAEAQAYLAAHPDGLSAYSPDTASTGNDIALMQERIDEMRGFFEEKNLPVGWVCATFRDDTGTVHKAESWSETLRCASDSFKSKKGPEKATIVLGWLITAAALSFGAPFWFDLLNRLVNLRGGSRKEVYTRQKTSV